MTDNKWVMRTVRNVLDLQEIYLLKQFTLATKYLTRLAIGTERGAP
jgi:hypothetical protein